MNHHQIHAGEHNRLSVRALLKIYPGITRVEIAERMKLSPMAVGRHVAAIRAEWGAHPLPTRRGRAVSKESTQW